ncbi:MAG: c-type cytochrome [Candidatus Tectomicrobia bacterium]|uniref:C-type cytochrome n=1 Tax=Tectimicrobiota bacterium TaxID=2528274 RepID=A0A932GQ21_UNCTE|nr:c-type cytochrome [Candidatus Tectomicrobia bacterium]
MIRSKFFQAILVLVLAFAFFRYGIRPPAPWSVVYLYMGIVLLAVLVYISSDSDSWRAFLRPIHLVLVDDEKRPIRLLLMVLLPLFLGYYAYSQAAAKVEAPPELRAVHPAPASSISFRGKTIDVQGFENPLRKDAANLRKYVDEGGEIYVKNCMFCHGDNLDGEGPFAHAFSPPPAIFTDPGTIAMLQEAYLFWRIAKGGPGWPKESTPWNSVMPAWEDRLTEEDIWKVIMYLYDATGFQPRRWEANAALIPFPSQGESAGKAVAARVPSSSLRSRRAERGLWSPALAEAQQRGDMNAGKAVYGKKCAICHGEKGDGNGPGASDLVITARMPGTSMPPWKGLPEKDRWNLVAYIKTFTPDLFKGTPKVLDLPKEVPPSKESIVRGKEMYEAIECNKCHGRAGRADGPSAPELKDDWEQPIRPADLTKPWNFRGGESKKEIATRLATGLAGTPMPSFLDSVEKPEDIWHLANYVKSLAPDKPNYATFLRVKKVEGEIPADPGAPFWSQQAPSNFPLAGQVIVDMRNFNPSIDMITVKAVYSSREIAIHLTWNDPTGSRPDPAAKTFADQVVLQFPVKLSEGNERPYVLMGDGSNPVYLLRWSSDGGVGEANATAISNLTPQPAQAVEAKGTGVFADGQYRLVIKRPLQTPDPNDLQFPVGKFFPVAFMAWDGGAGETGSDMSFSSWYYSVLEEPSSKRPYVIPPVVVLVSVAAELLIVRRAQRKARGSVN